MSERITELYFMRDERAIEETDKEYGKLLRQISLNLLNNTQDAEECVSDTYLQTWNTIPPNRPVSLKAYICKIIRNISINKLKYISAEKRSSGQIDIILDELSELIPSSENIEASIEGKALGEYVNEFLKKQNHEIRMIFLKRYWLFMSPSEIANDMHISLTKVTTSLYRTRLKLKKYLSEEGYDI